MMAVEVMLVGGPADGLLTAVAATNDEPRCGMS
jgi:hypothetical protein